MKRVGEVSQDEVWRHWMSVEETTNPEFRSDIRYSLPHDVVWYTSVIEEIDISSLFVISSRDWTDISRGSFGVLDVVAHVNRPTTNSETQRIGSDIRSKMAFLHSGGVMDSRLIEVTDNPDLVGPITFIEGNRRSVAFALRDKLIGCMIYVGVSRSITQYKWARQSYRHCSSRDTNRSR